MQKPLPLRLPSDPNQGFSMTRSEILSLMNTVLAKRGRAPVTGEAQAVREANFRSLDFSEVALRIETAIGKELAFDAASMRRIETVKDVLDFFEQAASAG
jgi:acyl carrier protein